MPLRAWDLAVATRPDRQVSDIDMPSVGTTRITYEILGDSKLAKSHSRLPPIGRLMGSKLWSLYPNSTFSAYLLATLIAPGSERQFRGRSLPEMMRKHVKNRHGMPMGWTARPSPISKKKEAARSSCSAKVPGTNVLRFVPEIPVSRIDTARPTVLEDSHD